MKNKWYIVIVLVFVVLLLIIWYQSKNSAIKDGFNEIKKGVEQITVPGPEVITPDPMVIVQEIRKLAKLETASDTTQQVIRSQRDTERIWGACGETMVFMAYGDVIVGLDLYDFQKNDLLIVDENTIKIHLPEPQILHLILDNRKSFVVDRDKGWFASFDKDMETRVRLQAQEEIEKYSIKMDILKEATQNAKEVITPLLTAFRFTNIEYTETSPVS